MASIISKGTLNVGWLVFLVAAVLLFQIGLDVYVRLHRREPEGVHKVTANSQGPY